MSFSLSKYLLNESLQSTILYQKILNDPTHYFYYVQYDIRNSYDESEWETKHTIYMDCIQLKTALSKILEKINISSWRHADDILKNFEKNVIESNIPTNKLIKLNAAYNRLADRYLAIMPKVFDKPHPEVLGYLMGQRRIDIFNIVDSNFTVYTYGDIKTDATKLNDLLNAILNNVCFFFGNNDEFRGLTTNDDIVSFGFNSSRDIPDSRRITATKEQFAAAVDRNKLLLGVGITNIDGIKLEWPIIAECFYSYKNEVGTEFIKSHNADLKQAYYNRKKNKQSKKPGDPTKPASNIQKLLNWGHSKEDYVIIYMPETKFGIKTSYYSNGYNEYKNMNKSTKRDYTKMSKPYKWSYDIFGDVNPYTLDGYYYAYSIDPETGKTKVERLRDGRYYSVDNFNYLFKKQNKERYDKIRKLQKATPEIKQANDDMINMQQKFITAIGIMNEYKKMLTDSDIPKQSRIYTSLFNSLNTNVVSQLNNMIRAFASYHIQLEELIAYVNSVKSGENTDDDSRIAAMISSKIRGIGERKKTFDDSTTQFLSMSRYWKNLFKEQNTSATTTQEG